MTSKYDHLASTKYLSNLCKDGTPLRGRIALLSFKNEISARSIDTLIMLIEYAQLVSIFIRGTYKFYSKHTINNVELYNIVSVFANVMSPGTFLPYNKEGRGTVRTVLIFCIAFFIFRVLLFLYIIWLAWKRKTGSGFLVQMWQWIFYLQTKVFCSAFASIFSNTYDAAFKDLLGVGSQEKYLYMVGGMTMIALECLFSLVLTTQFTNILPFKRFCASKNNSLELNVLLQKITNYLIRRVFNISVDASKWVLGLINIAFGSARIYSVFRKLPTYNYQSLRLQMPLLVSTLTVSVACLANLALDLKRVNMNFVIITWIILSIFGTKLAFAYLEKNLWELVFEKGINTKRSPEFLVHKIIFIKQILKENKLPDNTTLKSDIYHLLASTLTPKFSDLECKITRNKVFMHYLEELMGQFPKNNFLKLYSAYRYVRKNKLYGLSIKTLAEINSNYPTVVASKSILNCLLARHPFWWGRDHKNLIDIVATKTSVKETVKHFIQTKTQSDYQYGVYVLNLYDYCKGVANLSKMKLKMVEQAKLQWDLCDEIASGSPDLAKILTLGNKANMLKQQIQKSFKKISEQMPDYHVGPYLLYANYNLFMKYSSENHIKYKEICSKKLQKYTKQFESDQLLQENLFQGDTFFIVVSGEKETAGKINYVSPAFAEILGRDLSGSQASVATPHFIRPNTINLIKSLMSQNALTFQNTERFQFFYHLKGYMIPFNYYLNINPSIYGGLSFIFICRCSNQGKEFILLNDNGEIESFTKGIGETLGLFSKDGLYLVDDKTSISQICPEFTKQVNQAFNIAMGILEAPILLSLEEAEEICRVYSLEGEGKSIILTPIHQKKSLVYRCTVKALMVGTKVGKIMTLEKVHNMNEEEEDLREDVNSEWINFERLKSEQHITMTTRNENNLLMQNTLASTRNLITSRVPLMIERGTTTEVIENSTGSNENIPAEVKKKARSEKYKPRWLKNNQAKISKLYQQALEKPYFPFFYRILITALYTMFLAVFTMYLYMSVNMHKGISDLETSKQILRMAEARNNYLGALDVSTRFLWTYATQPSSITDYFQGTFVALQLIAMVHQITVDELQTVNGDLLIVTSLLDEGQREDLFQKDIRMFDVNSTSSLDTYVSLTSFQATDQIVEASLKINGLVQTNLKSAVPYLKFVLRNIMNDMLIKNTEISQSFRESLEEKKSSFEGWITACFSCSLCLLVLIVIGYIYVLYLQAKNESSHLFALTRLKPESMNSLKQDFLVFHDLVLKDQNSAGSSDLFSFDDSKSKVSSKKVVQHQEQNRQLPIERGLWPAYYLSLLKFCLLISILMGLFLANFILFKKYLNRLSTKASQISFIEQMSSTLGVLSGSFLEVISENDATIIENIQASKSLSHQISQLTEMIQSVSNVLGVGASENNDFIQDILYGDACGFLKDSALSYRLCRELANYQEKAGLTNLLSNIESSVKLVYSKFIDSDRAEQTLLNLQVEAFNEISVPVFLVIQVVNDLVAEELNSDFERIASNSQALDIALNTVILVLIVVETVVIHFWIIKKLKQKETQFKQMLGLFPASVVLPNFILKSYIMKVSNQTFNSFRDNTL